MKLCDGFDCPLGAVSSVVVCGLVSHAYPVVPVDAQLNIWSITKSAFVTARTPKQAMMQRGNLRW